MTFAKGSGMSECIFMSIDFFHLILSVTVVLSFS